MYIRIRGVPAGKQSFNYSKHYLIKYFNLFKLGGCAAIIFFLTFLIIAPHRVVVGNH